MATSTLAAVDIANMALRNLGDDPIDSLAGNERRAKICNQFYTTVRDATLSAHPWNFATKRVALASYTEPDTTLTPGAGATVVDTTGVTFTAGAASFASTDVDKRLEGDGVAGKATITGFTSNLIVTATITEAFSSLAAIASGSWRLVNAAPEWGPTETITLPDDCLRVWRVEDNLEYRVEGQTIVTDEQDLNVLYIQQISDVTQFSFLFVQTLVAHLTAIIAEPITGQLGKGDAWFKLYQFRLREARTADGMEGAPEKLKSRTLIDVRTSG